MKIAIDIVLLPSEEMMDKAIEVNKDLLKENPPKIVLNKKTCLPHISLMMAIIEEKDLPEIRKKLQEVTDNFESFDLITNSTSIGELPNGETTPAFIIEKTVKLQELHEKVMNGLKSFCSKKSAAEMFFNPSEVDELTVNWVSNYPKKSSYEKFNPHITLGFGRIKNPMSCPINFKANRLAVCQLGSYCTCRKILIDIKL